MLTKVWSAASKGLNPIEVEVEVNVAAKGFPAFNIVGLPTKAVEEAKERVRIRHRGKLIPCRIKGKKVLLAKPEYGVAPGQIAVIYNGLECLGGGVIVDK